MQFPGEAAYREEAAALLATMDSLTDDEFDNAPTLCEGWAPRDVLAHVVGIDTDFDAYVRGVTISRGNRIMTGRFRKLSRKEVMDQARHWAEQPGFLPRLASRFLLGDLVMHHQDILRPLGRTRELDESAAAAIFREGAVVLGSYKLLRYRVEPTDGGRPLGRGRTVRGTREALALWLGGRKGIEVDLEFR